MFSRRRFLQAGTAAAAANAASAKAAGTIELALQSRDRNGSPLTARERVESKENRDFCDRCWHYHWCRTWRNRAGSLMPRFNHSFEAARTLGMTLVFSPTNAMRDLNDSRQRQNTLALPDQPLPPLANLTDPYPRNLRYGMCECGLGDDCHYTNNVNNQHPDLVMRDNEYIALTSRKPITY